MEPSVAVEKHRSRETALERLVRHTGEFFSALLRLVGLALLLTPLLLISLLTVDIPMRRFDFLAGGNALLRPSHWLSWGLFIMSIAPLTAILFTRKFGGEEASRAVTASWAIAALAVFAGLSYLAPALEDSDMPPARFAVAFVASAMAAQYMAVNIYDIARGGGRWWRAPLFAALGGGLTFTFIYFPGLYWGAPAPWLNWAVASLAIHAGLVAAFLPMYALARRALRPKGGFGGS